MFRFLVYGQCASLQVLVGGGDVRVPGLIACHNDASGIGQVADARVLQTVELVAAGEAEKGAYLVEVIAEDA